MYQQIDWTQNAAEKQAHAIATGYTNVQKDVDNAAKALTDALADPTHFDAAARGGTLFGEVWGDKVIAALNSKNPQIRALALEQQNQALNELRGQMGMSPVTADDMANAATRGKLLAETEGAARSRGLEVAWTAIDQKAKYDAAKAAADQAKASVDAWNQGVLDGANAASWAWANITKIITESVPDAVQASTIWGELNSQAVKEGLNSQSESTRLQMQQQVATLNAELSHLLDLHDMDPKTQKLMTDIRDGVVKGTMPVNVAMERVASIFPNALAAEIPVIQQLGSDTTQAYADGLRSSRDAIDSAIKQLNDDQKKAISKPEEIRRLVETLISEQLQAGLRSGDALVRADAQNVKALLIEQLRAIGVEGKDVSADSKAMIANALKSGDADIVRAARETQADLDTIIATGAAKRETQATQTAAATALTQDKVNALNAQITDLQNQQSAAAQAGDGSAIAAITKKIADARQQIADLTSALTGTVPSTKTPAESALEQLDSPDALKKAQTAAGNLLTSIKDVLGDPATLASFAAYGTNIAEAFSNALANGIALSQPKIDGALNMGTRGMRAESPPKEGPLHLVDVWGASIGDVFMKGIADSLTTSALPLDALGRQLGGFGAADRVAPMPGSRVGGTDAMGGNVDRQIELLGQVASGIALQSQLLARMVPDTRPPSSLKARTVLEQQQFLQPGQR